MAATIHIDDLERLKNRRSGASNGSTFAQFLDILLKSGRVTGDIVSDRTYSMIMGPIETVELENELLEGDWKRLTQLVHSIVDTAPPKKHREKSKAQTNKHRNAALNEHKRSLTSQAQHALHVIVKHNTEWAAFVHDYVLQHGKLPDNKDPKTWLIAAWLLLYPEQSSCLAFDIALPSTNRAVLDVELTRLAFLCDGGLLDAWKSIAFPGIDAPLWFVDGRTPAMRRDYIVARLSDTHKPDIPSILGYAPLLNGAVSSDTSKELLNGEPPNECTPGINLKVLERITTPYAGQWTTRCTSALPVVSANMTGKIRVEIRGIHGTIDIEREWRLFGPSNAVDTLCAIQEDPVTSKRNEVELSDAMRESVRKRIYAVIKSGGAPKSNLCADDIHRRLEIVGFPVEINGNGTYEFEFALCVAKFDKYRDMWVPEANTQFHTISHVPSLELHLAFGRTRLSPPTYKTSSLLMPICNVCKTDQRLGLSANCGVMFNFSFEWLSELHRVCVRNAVHTAEMIASNRSIKHRRNLRVPWKRATVNDARRMFISSDELGRLELVPHLEASAYVPPRVPPRATNTGLAFPHVLRLDTLDRSVVQNVVFAGDHRRDIALDFRIKLYGEDVCESAVLLALETTAPAELVFDVALVTTTPDSATRLTLGVQSFHRTRAHEGIVTIFAQLSASAATMADDGEFTLRLTARHPQLATTLIGHSPPFFISKYQHSVADTPLDKYDGYLPGGARVDVPVVDVGNHIDRLTLRRCHSEAETVNERTYSATEYNEMVERLTKRALAGEERLEKYQRVMMDVLPKLAGHPIDNAVLRGVEEMRTLFEEDTMQPIDGPMVFRPQLQLLRKCESDGSMASRMRRGNRVFDRRGSAIVFSDDRGGIRTEAEALASIRDRLYNVDMSRLRVKYTLAARAECADTEFSQGIGLFKTTDEHTHSFTGTNLSLHTLTWGMLVDQHIRLHVNVQFFGCSDDTLSSIDKAVCMEPAICTPFRICSKA